MHILIIEDDHRTAEFMQKGLLQANHVVDLAACLEDGEFLAFNGCYEVLIIDRMLAGRDGLQLVERLRSRGVFTPVLILSALAKVGDRIVGLRRGADDYLTKPFDFEELVARAEALGRRPSNTGWDRTLRVGDLEMDLARRCVSRGGQTIDIKPREFRLLEYLMRHVDQVVTRAMLLENVWDYHFDPQTNVIDVHISRLRQKIDVQFEKRLLRTVRGAGYMISARP